MLLSVSWRLGPWKLIRSTQKHYRFPVPPAWRERMPHVAALDTLEGRFSRREILAKAGTWTTEIRRLLDRMEENGLVEVSERLELYNVATDPREEKELSAVLPDTAQALLVQMRQKLEQIGAGRSFAHSPTMTERERDQLRSLGYLD